VVERAHLGKKVAYLGFVGEVEGVAFGLGPELLLGLVYAGLPLGGNYYLRPGRYGSRRGGKPDAGGTSQHDYALTSEGSAATSYLIF